MFSLARIYGSFHHSSIIPVVQVCLIQSLVTLTLCCRCHQYCYHQVVEGNRCGGLGVWAGEKFWVPCKLQSYIILELVLPLNATNLHPLYMPSNIIDFKFTYLLLIGSMPTKNCLRLCCLCNVQDSLLYFCVTVNLADFQLNTWNFLVLLSSGIQAGYSLRAYIPCFLTDKWLFQGELWFGP